MNCAENPFKMGMFLQLEVSFKIGAFSDTQHTHPGILILESPPWDRCMYVHKCVFVYICVYMCVHKCVYMYVSVCACTWYCL